MVDKPAFKMGDYVEKISGSSWRGRVVGTYSTDLTPEGYAVESDTEKGSVQIYPAKALRLATADEFETVEEFERGDQRELSMLYSHKAHDRPQFNRGQMREAIRHGRRLATEDARSRVKVLEEALGKAREYVERKSWDAYDNREDQLLVVIDTALGNKETDRHG